MGARIGKLRVLAIWPVLICGKLRVLAICLYYLGVNPIRIVIAKPGLDGHDRGAKVIARALRDAGFEVIYTGLHQTPEQIVQTAIQEDADAIGMSILSGAHLTLFPAVIDLLAAKGASDIVVFGGGVIPTDDVTQLQGSGVAHVFTPGTPIGDVVEWVRANVGVTSVR
jgi:methylmalonyl-CoA mutase C-terminal domain/subunit